MFLAGFYPRLGQAHAPLSGAEASQVRTRRFFRGEASCASRKKRKSGEKRLAASKPSSLQITDKLTKTLVSLTASPPYAVIVRNIKEMWPVAGFQGRDAVVQR
jgi:hypothetical protein